jgi:predicted ATP-grasp superfamily ATP-dependent carboligase
VETLQAAGAPVPRGVRLRYDDPWPDDFPLPAVLKPNDGCGSQGLRLVRSHSDDVRSVAHEFWRLEEYVAGQAASWAVIRGSGGDLWLAPCLQYISDDGTFRYLGGSSPVLAEQSRRFVELLRRCWTPIPDFHGYIGFDLVLGTAEDGSGDRLIEINPRLTTSYHAHHALTRNNLLGAMIEVVEGRAVMLEARSGCIKFEPDGRFYGVLDSELNDDDS